MFRITLKELRERKHISQKQLADILSVAQGAVGNWESGIREPGFDTMLKIAEYFNVSVDYLLGRESPVETEFNALSFALNREIEDLTDEQKKQIIDFAKFVKQLEKDEK